MLLLLFSRPWLEINCASSVGHIHFTLQSSHPQRGGRDSGRYYFRRFISMAFINWYRRTALVHWMATVHSTIALHCCTAYNNIVFLCGLLRSFVARTFIIHSIRLLRWGDSPTDWLNVVLPITRLGHSVVIYEIILYAFLINIVLYIGWLEGTHSNTRDCVFTMRQELWVDLKELSFIVKGSFGNRFSF